MTSRARPALMAAALLSAALAAGCGSAPGLARACRPQAPPGGGSLRATARTTRADTWATAVMGGPAVPGPTP